MHNSSKGKILGAAIGNCIHTLTLSNFLAFAEKKSYSSLLLGFAVSIPVLINSIKEIDPQIIIVSYRLTANAAEPLFIELKDAIDQNKLTSKVFILAGTPPVIRKGKLVGIFKAFFSGVDEFEDVISILVDEKNREKKPILIPKTLVEYINLKYPYPLIRHHYGQSTVDETIKGAKEISEAKILDILSIGPDQSAQEFFFDQERIDPKLDGSGGVPIRKKEDLERIFHATRTGNYPLLRCYAGTNNVMKWASLLKETINIAWGAVPLFWYSELDGRSSRPILNAIEENQQAIRWYARNNIPIEVNESHQWALRITSEAIEVATAYIASYNAKKLGANHYVMQYMFNTPPGISPKMDLAKMLAKIEITEKLMDDSFVSYRMVRTGLASLSQDPFIAKGQLASSIAIAMAINPHIIHVVGYSEADHIATSQEIIESCKIAKGVVSNCLLGMPDISSDKEILERKDVLLGEVKFLLSAIEELKNSNNIDPLVDPRTLTKAIKIGLLDAPLFKGCKFAKGEIQTKIINGSVYAINPEDGEIFSEYERVSRIMEKLDEE